MQEDTTLSGIYVGDKPSRSGRLSRLIRITRRFLIPRPIVSLGYYFRFGAKISLRAEVEWTKNIRFGRSCVVGSFTKVKASDGLIEFGDRCGIATGCFISAGANGIAIGDNFICGPNVAISSHNYQYTQFDTHLEDQGETSKGVRIGNNVWIGAGSVILDGSVIGDNSIVVANSLVNHRFRAGSMICGNPAKVLMKR